MTAGRKLDAKKTRWDRFPWRVAAWIMGQRPEPIGMRAFEPWSEKRNDLLPQVTIDEVGKVLAFGCIKYEINNWQHVPNARRRYFAAAIRHLVAWWLGWPNDKDTGLSHLSHALCCIHFLLWFDLTKVPTK